MSFEWAAVEPQVLEGLAEAAGLGGSDPAAAMTRRFGPEPSEDFIAEMWPALRSVWLTEDADSALDLAMRLQARGVGRSELPLDSHDDWLVYLRSCRISRAVREEALLVFLDAGWSGDDDEDDDEDDDGTRVDFLDTLRLSLAWMRIENVPGLITAAQQFNSSAFGAAMVIVNAPALAPAGFEVEAIRRADMPRPVRLTAQAVAEGARAWSRMPMPLLLQLLEQYVEGSEQGTLMILHLLWTGGDPGRTPDPMVLIGFTALLAWTENYAAGTGAVARPEPVGPGTAGRRPTPPTDMHPVVAGALSAAGDDESIYATDDGGVWFASEVGGTFVAAGREVRARGHVVTPVVMDTAVKPRRRPAEPRLAALLSEANVHNGVNAMAWVDGTVRVRTALATHDRVNGWIAPFAGVAMLASAMHALHLEPALRGNPVAGPDGVRHDPSPLVAEFGGWEVADEDADQYPLPHSTAIESMVDEMVGRVAEIERGDSLVAVRLPGPNGKLEGWLNRRRGRSDDQQLTISKVTRDPWGAGVKFVLRVPNPGARADNEVVALRWNDYEWEQVPAINVWGGWSGEDDVVRLTSFIPQMLMRPSESSNLRLIANFLSYAMNRGALLATALASD